MPIVTLQHSFPYTNLDLENPSPNGGPIKVLTQGGSTFANANTEGFIQQYTPKNPLFGIRQNGEKSTLLDIKRNSPLPNSFDETDLDLENPLPNGGPIKVLAQGGTTGKNFKKGYTQTFTPTNTYLNDINKKDGVYNSIFGNISFIYG